MRETRERRVSEGVLVRDEEGQNKGELPPPSRPRVGWMW
jgi:hypothetical protein